MGKARVRYNSKTRQATLAGVDFQDLRCILTGAFLHYDEVQKKAKKEKDSSMGEYAENLLKTLDYLDGAFKDAIARTHGRPFDDYRGDHLMPSQLTVKQRRERIAEERKMRELFERLLGV